MRRTARMLLICCLALVPAAIRVHGQEAAKGAAAAGSGAPEQRLVEAYDSLAETIIALEKAESKLMHGLLGQYHASAQQHLAEAQAAAAGGKDPAKHLEMAAEEIGKLAVEGGRDVEAIKLRLQKAGHHHNTAEGESFEYLLVGPELRKQLLELSKQTGQLGAGAKADQIQKVAEEIRSAYGKIQ